MLPLSSEALVYGLSCAVDPRISPDGAHVAYTVGRTDADLIGRLLGWFSLHLGEPA